MTTASLAPAPTGPAPVVQRARGYRRVRPYVLSATGLLVATVFALPYVVMLLDALRPSGDVLATPPSFLPRTWQWNTFGTILSDARFLSWLKSR